MWRQLIDHPEAWPESSSSAMFSFALITGVKHGWLDAATYAPAARKGWIAVAGYVDQNHDVTQVCSGTNKFDSLEYYLERPVALETSTARHPSCGLPLPCCATRNSRCNTCDDSHRVDAEVRSIFTE
jgi:rhamnogalacturonyl hydrolase YesR